MAPCPSARNALAPHTYTFYRQSLLALHAAQVPFLIGGAYALEHYTGVTRQTKDLDLFVQSHDLHRTLAVLRAAGYHTELTSSHWLGKANAGEDYIDVVFSGGNGIANVDETWFTHAVEGEILDLPVRFCPPEEMLWSKAYVMERERYDGADIAHLLRACGEEFDWPRLLHRFGLHWRVLCSHLLLFGFIYPAERSLIPHWVIQELVSRWLREEGSALPTERLCQGTLLSRAQYLIDIQEWGYGDGRLPPTGNLTAENVAQWTAAIQEQGESNDSPKGECASGSHR